MQRFASVRFDAALAPSERVAVACGLDSAGVALTSWKTCGDRTYATLCLDGQAAYTDVVAALAAASTVDARVDVPALVILRITPDAPRLLGALERALGGAGRPAGVCETWRDATSVIVACDGAQTSLATLVALVDCELASAPGRTIEPLASLADETLVTFAGALLGEPALAPDRLIETHLANVRASANA